MAEPVEIIRSRAFAGIPHGFLGRRGGVSTGLVAGLNVGLGASDADAAVIENRRRAIDAVLPGARLVTLYQVHSAETVIVETPWEEVHRPRADALATRCRGLLLGIVTADCAAVLLADRDAGVIGAAHAGWRGAHGGIVASAIAAMESLGAKRSAIAAAIGPCIAQQSYEVGATFKSAFAPEDDAFFVPGKPGHFQFDLEGLVAARLHEAGVGIVDRLGLDTYADQARFFSYRRSTHRGEDTYGRQFSLIGLAA